MSTTKRNRGGARKKSSRSKSTSRKSVFRSLQPTSNNLLSMRSTRRVKNIPKPSMGRHGWQILKHKAARNRSKKIKRRNIRRSLFPERQQRPQRMNIIHENSSMIVSEPEQVGRPRRQAARAALNRLTANSRAREQQQQIRQQQQQQGNELANIFSGLSVSRR